MSASTNIAINFIAEYKGRQKLNTAQKDMNVLGDAAKKLGSILLATFSAEKIISFGKASVAAFAADQKSAAILANTLSNLGQTMSDVPVENFITKLSELNGIAKTDLRTSFDTLVRSTGDATKAQDLLNLTLDISAGTGKDVALVSTALAKAYGGNYAAISKLGAGVSKTLLATKDFTKIQGFLTATFKGNASTAAETYQGKIDRLKTSYEEFKITIGKGLVDAFANLSSKGKLSDFQDSMANTATNIANMVTGLGLVLGYVDKIGSATIKKDSFFDKLFNAGKILAIGGIFGLANATLGEKQAKTKAAADKAALEAQNLYGAKAKYFAAIAAKTAAKAIADAKALTQAQKDKLALERASLSLKLAGNTTDMANIEIQAALQRGQTDQVNTVLLLQRAIIDGNASDAGILAEQVLRANNLVMDVNGHISSLATAKNPFADWPAYTDAEILAVKKLEDEYHALEAAILTAAAAAAKLAQQATMTANQKAIADIAAQMPTAQYPHGFTPEGVPIVTASQAAADAAQSAQDQADMLAAAQASQALAEAAAQAAIDSATAASDAAYAKALAAIAALDAQYAALTGSPSSSIRASQIAATSGAGSSTYMDYLNGLNNNGLYANPSSNGSSTIGDYQKANPIVVNVQIDGTAITNTLVNNSASGIPTTMNRSGYFAGLTS